MTDKTIALHSDVYVAESLVNECKSELWKLSVRVAMGDRISPLEKLAYFVLRQTGHIPQAESGVS